MPGSEQEYRYWGRLASTFHEDNLYVVGPNIYPEVKEWLVGEFSDKDTVLELGCGTGFFTEMIEGSVRSVTATDLAPKMTEQARERLEQYGNVAVQMEDCYKTSFEENAFDAVLMGNLIHIVIDPIAVLKESYRVLKEDGRVVIVDLTGYGMGFFNKMGLVIRYLRRYGKPCSYSKNLRPDKLAQIAQEAGFVVEELKLIGNDTKAVCLRGRRTKREDIHDER